MAAAFFGFFQFRVSYAGALQRGELALAGKMLDRLVWVGLDHSTLRRQLGRLWIDAGNHPAAITQIERGLALEPSAADYVALGALYKQQGQWGEAADAFMAGLDLKPDHLGLLQQAGKAWLELGQPERALPLWEHAAKVAPERAEVRQSLAELRRLIAQGRRMQRPPARPLPRASPRSMSR